MQNIKDIFSGDIITFKAKDGRYKLLLCTSTYKERSPHFFTFAVLSYNSIEQPTLNEIQECYFLGTGNTRSENYKYSDSELEKMWSCHPEIKPYFLGSYSLDILRKDFIKFRDHLALVGTVSIVDYLDKLGGGGMGVSDWAFLQDFFGNDFKSVLFNRGQQTFKLKAILRN